MRYLPEVEAINSFSIVAEELNFRRAAERLGIDHSALSRRIRDLEHRLGFSVLERSTREVRLTEAGKVFLDENRTLMRALQRSIDNARLVAEGMAGRIRIGYMSFAAAKLMPDAIARFRAIRPDVRFELTYLRSHAQKEALSRNEIDVGLMIGPWDTGAFITHTVARDRLCVFFGQRSLFSRKRKTNVTELTLEPLIMGSLEQWDLYRWVLDDLFLKKGIVPNVVLEASSISGMMGLVQAGLGVTLFPRCVTALCPPSVGHRVLSDSDLSIETICVTARKPSPLVQEFVATIGRNDARDVAGKHGSLPPRKARGPQLERAFED